MGFWKNEPKDDALKEKKKATKGLPKQESRGHGSTWTQGRQVTANALTILVAAALIAGPLSLVLSLQNVSRPAEAAPVAEQGSQLTAQEEKAGAYAVGLVGAWLGAWKDHPGELGEYVDVGSLGKLSEEPGKYRDLAVSTVTPNNESDIVTVVVAANVKELAEDPEQEGAAIEKWPRRYFQVPVLVSSAGMSVVSLPTPVAAPADGGDARLAYPEELPSTDASYDTVVSFLAAYATGSGDLSRFVSPEAAITAITPAPYLSVEADEIKADVQPPKTPKDGVTVRVLATVSFTSQLDQTVTSTYALTLTARAARWEVSSIDPAPKERPKSSSASQGASDADPSSDR